MSPPDDSVRAHHFPRHERIFCKGTLTGTFRQISERSREANSWKRAKQKQTFCMDPGLNERLVGSGPVSSGLCRLFSRGIGEIDCTNSMELRNKQTIVFAQSVLAMFKYSNTEQRKKLDGSTATIFRTE